MHILDLAQWVAVLLCAIAALLYAVSVESTGFAIVAVLALLACAGGLLASIRAHDSRFADVDIASACLSGLMAMFSFRVLPDGHAAGILGSLFLVAFALSVIRVFRSNWPSRQGQPDRGARSRDFR